MMMASVCFGDGVVSPSYSYAILQLPPRAVLTDIDLRYEDQNSCVTRAYVGPRGVFTSPRPQTQDLKRTA